MGNEVELIGVSKHYGALEEGKHSSRAALDNISVGFQKEKITAIIGTSGSGKSTLLKCINGIVKPSSGKVIVAGKTGYVIQGSGLFPHLTVGQNISLPGKIAGQTGNVSELLEFTALPLEYKNKYPWQLSGGEQQRVALCRALFLKPPVILMDEPFGSLDTYTRRDLQQKILELREQFKLTMIIVTHDIPEALRLADDILVLEGGRVQQFGSAKSLANQLPN